MSSTVQVGASSDTAEVFTVTLNRNADDTTSDLTQLSTVVLELPDGTTKTLTVASSSTPTWVGTVKYAGWFTKPDTYKTRARGTFGDGTVMTWPDPLYITVVS